MKALVTGSEGFIASYLIQELIKKGYDVAGIARKKHNRKINYTFFAGDIKNPTFIDRIVQDYQPDMIFHLAAQSNIPYSWDHPTETVDANTNGSVHIFESVRLFSPKSTVISVGSSAEYGSIPSPMHEEDVLKPTSPYGITKMMQGYFAKMYRSVYKLNIIHVRPFGIIGPGKKGDVLSDFARQIVLIEKGAKPQISVGDIERYRDFLDVRDAVRAFVIIAENGKEDIYNICSGHKISLRDILEIMEQEIKINITLTKNKQLIRPSDDAIILGDSSRLFSLGFNPEFKLSQSVKDILTYYRKAK